MSKAVRACWETDDDGYCPMCGGDIKRCPVARKRFDKALAAVSSDRDPATMDDDCMD